MAYRKIEDSKLTAIANAIRSKLGVTDTMTLDKMPSYIESIGIDIIPEYWKSYLASKATEISSALSAAGENKSAFLWYTDAHWTTNYGTSPVLLKYLSKHTGMQKTFFGGDIAQGKSGEIAVLTAWQELVKEIPNHHSVLGNHDNQVTDLPSSKSDFFFGHERTSDVVYGTDETNGKNYYYIDNHIEKTRYICLSTGRMWTYEDEIEWCIGALNGVPEGWHIVVISHLWLNCDYNNGASIITTPENYTQVYLSLFDAYNSRARGTTSMGSKSYNFVDAKANIEFVIGGHVHQDYDFTTNTGIPVILTECDGYGERDDISVAQKGTISENCMYAIIADYNLRSVKVINVGRGDTRSVVLPGEIVPEEPAYTNQLAIAIDETGAIYNGIGYKPNIRINSSMEETSAPGWYMTGYIPAKKYDVLYFANMEYMDISGDGGEYPRTMMAFYNESFVKIGQTANHYLPNHTPEIAMGPAYGDNGDVIQMTVPNWGGDETITYIRLCCGYLDGNSIITVNEPINNVPVVPDVPDEPVNSKNKIPTAIGFDGNVLNAGSTPGFSSGRYSTSSNKISPLAGTYVTGLIECPNDAVIYMRNISTEQGNGYNGVIIFNMNDTDGNGVYYNAKYTFTEMRERVSQDDVFKVVEDENGTMIQFKLPGWQVNQTHIAICSQYIGSDSIITVNEPID